MRINFKLIYIFAHIALTLIISLVTLSKLEAFLFFPYISLSLISISSLAINCTSPFEKDKPKFLYIFSLFVVLGCWFKFSMYKILDLSEFREPIGSFILGSDSESKVLWICFLGILAIFITSILSKFLPNLKKLSKADDSKNYKVALIVFVSTILLSYINLKFNILLFALKPEVILPFKGNVIFFLLLTRGLPFVYLFFCLKKFDLFYIFIGSLIFSISSIGVLSRLGILIYFIIILMLTLENISSWSFRNIIKNISVLALIFSFSTYLNVSIATGARNYLTESFSSLSNATTDLAVTEVISKSTNSDKVKTLKDLALGRWIGTEGVMAVVSYQHKSFALLAEAFTEKSYKGDSFYSKILNISNSKKSKVVSTSVPGPIAFYFYSGSLVFVFIALLISTLLFVITEKGLISLYGGFNPAIALVVSFLALDYHQFGIAPLAFVKYCLFTVSGAVIFYILTRYKFIKNYFTQYSWPFGKN